MIVDPRWGKRQLDPNNLGPYEVVARTGNSYSLVDKERALLNRVVPIHQLRIISLPHKYLAEEKSQTIIPICSRAVSDAIVPSVSPATPAVITPALPAFHPEIKRSQPKRTKTSVVKTLTNTTRRKPRRSKKSSTNITSDLYIVHEILDHKFDKERGMMFRVHWQGYPEPKFHTWEPAHHIPDCLKDQYLADQTPAPTSSQF